MSENRGFEVALSSEGRSVCQNVPCFVVRCRVAATTFVMRLNQQPNC